MTTSVVLCTYNGEKYLNEQMESLRKQSVKIDEVIICDDCSTDNTVQIICEFISSNALEHSWKLFVNEKNKGYANNFHDALMKATKEVIFFCDQDDIWHVDKIEKMVSIMEQNADICVLGAEFEDFVSSEDAPVYANRALDDETIEKIELNRKTIFIENGFEGCTECITKEFRDEIANYWKKGIAHDEFVWKMGLCYEGCYLYHSKLLDRRFHSNNTSKQKLHDKAKRILFLERLLVSHEAMLSCAEKYNNADAMRLIEKNIKLVKLRVRLLKKCDFFAWVIGVLRYMKYYQKPKSALVDLWIAIYRR